MAARSPVKGAQQQEHNGLTEGSMCKESQQMSRHHVISRDKTTTDEHISLFAVCQFADSVGRTQN